MDKQTKKKIDDTSHHFFELIQQNQNTQAISVGEALCVLLRQNLKPDEPFIAICLSEMAELYDALEDLPSAERYYQQACTAFQSGRGEKSQPYVYTLNRFASIYRRTEQLTKAEEIYNKALQVQKEFHGEKNTDYALTLGNLAALYYEMHLYEKSEAMGNQAVKIYRELRGYKRLELMGLFGTLARIQIEANKQDAAKQSLQEIESLSGDKKLRKDPEVLDQLMEVVEMYKDLRDYAQAEVGYREILEIIKSNNGSENEDYANILNKMGSVNILAEHYAEAEQNFYKALDIQSAILPGDDIGIAQTLENLAFLYDLTGKFQEAATFYKRSIDIYQTSDLIEEPDLADRLISLAEIYSKMGLYKSAEPLRRQAMAIYSKTHNSDDPFLVDQLNELAGLYKDLGDYQQAREKYQQALDIIHKNNDEDTDTLAKVLNNIGLIYVLMGNYADAEQAYRNSLHLVGDQESETSFSGATVHLNLATLYDNLGNYSEALRLYDRALKVFMNYVPAASMSANVANLLTNLYQNPSVLVATCLDNMANLARETGNFQDSTQFYRRALTMWKTSVGEKHESFAIALSGLALAYEGMGNYRQAEQILKWSLRIISETLGNRHLDYGFGLSNLGVLNIELGCYEPAETSLKQAMDILYNNLGNNHPQVAIVEANLGLVAAARDHFDDSLKLLGQANDVDDRIIGQAFTFATEKQRMAFLATLRDRIAMVLSLIIQYMSASSAAVHAALDLVLRRKAIAAEALSVQRDAIFSGRYPELQGKLKELSEWRRKIANKTLDGPGLEGTQAYQSLLAEWTTKKENLEADLARQIPEMNLQMKLSMTDCQAISQALPEGSALVEFIRIYLYDFKALPAKGEKQWQPARYLALILCAGEPDKIHLVSLGEAGVIEQELSTFRAAITGQMERIYPQLEPTPDATTRSDRAALYHAITTRNLIPADAVHQPAGDIAEGTALRQILFDPLLPFLNGRTRLFLAPDGELARLPFEVLPLDGERRLIDAFQISYLGAGRDVLRFQQSSRSRASQPLVVADPDFDLGTSPDTSFRPGDPFSRLTGTCCEGETIAKLLGVQPLMGEHALEASLKACQSPYILHFATHGFFLPNVPRDPNQMQAKPEGIDRNRLGSYAAAENPLLRSGLALAGANRSLQSLEMPEEAEDGILTAEDVTGLDLLDTELVVLSACETGLGEVQVGEGVFGLRRSFVLAGAHTLVISLWKVPDRQTQELMEDFYCRILKGEPRAEALRAAQLAMKARYPEPLYWGAFICQGDPGPLQRKELDHA